MNDKIINKIINWWEEDLTTEERKKLLGVESWTAVGGIEERHKKLREMRKKYLTQTQK